MASPSSTVELDGAKISSKRSATNKMSKEHPPAQPLNGSSRECSVQKRASLDDGRGFLPSRDAYYPQGLDEVKRFELFTEMIKHEDDLLNQRVSWIILAQSFLMAAFISAASNVENRAFLFITAGVGLATVIVTMPALIAAGRNIEVQQRVYFLGLDSDEQCQRLHGHDRDTSQKSTDEMVHRRLKGHLFPNTAFRGRFGVPILNTVMALAVVQVAGWCGLLVALMIDS